MATRTERAVPAAHKPREIRELYKPQRFTRRFWQRRDVYDAETEADEQLSAMARSSENEGEKR